MPALSSVALALTLFWLRPAAPPKSQVHAAPTLDARIAAIVPKPSEDRWLQIPWRIVARVTDRAKDSVSVAFSGSFQMVHNGSLKRGYQGRIEGEFAMSAAQASFSKFRALATGKAWGDGTYNPHAPQGRYPLVVAMVEAKDEVARVVPPEAVSTENNDRPYRNPTLHSNIRQ